MNTSVSNHTVQCCAACGKRNASHKFTGPDGPQTLCSLCSSRYGKLELRLYRTDDGKVTAKARNGATHLVAIGFPVVRRSDENTGKFAHGRRLGGRILLLPIVRESSPEEHALLPVPTDPERAKFVRNAAAVAAGRTIMPSSGPRVTRAWCRNGTRKSPIIVEDSDSERTGDGKEYVNVHDTNALLSSSSKRLVGGSSANPTNHDHSGGGKRRRLDSEHLRYETVRDHPQIENNIMSSRLGASFHLQRSKSPRKDEDQDAVVFVRSVPHDEFRVPSTAPGLHDNPQEEVEVNGNGKAPCQPSEPGSRRGTSEATIHTKVELSQPKKDRITRFRHLTFKRGLPYKDFTELLRKCYGLGGYFSIVYEDLDGDLIAVEHEEDMKGMYAVTESQKSISRTQRFLKLRIIVDEEKASAQDS